MDDLLQSLGSSGHGSSTRSRVHAGGDAEDGAAFGMAFEATGSNKRDLPDRNVLPAPHADGPHNDGPLGDGTTNPDGSSNTAEMPMDEDRRFDPTAPLVLPSPDQDASFVLPRADQMGPLILPAPNPDGALIARTTPTGGPLILPMPGQWNADGQPQVLPGVFDKSGTGPLLPQTQPPARAIDLLGRSGGQGPQILPSPKMEPAGPLVLPSPTPQPLTEPTITPAQGRDIAATGGPQILPSPTVPSTLIAPGSGSANPMDEATLDTALRPSTAHKDGGPVTLPASTMTSPTAPADQLLGRVAEPMPVPDARIVSGGQTPQTPPASATVPTLVQSLLTQSVVEPQRNAPTTVGDGSRASLPPVRPNMTSGVPQTAAPISAPLSPLTPSSAPEPEREARISLRMADSPSIRTGSWTPSVSVETPPTPLQTVMAFSAQTGSVTGADVMPQSLDGVEFGLQTNAVTSTTLIGTTAVPIPQAPSAHAHAMAQQIASILAEPGREPGGMVELALDPPELGRLRMQMTEVAGVMTLTIHAERPETAELMRRHLDLLAQEFAQAGLNAPSVSISQEGADQGGQGARDDDQGGRSHQSLADDTLHQTPPPQRTAHGALDIRL